MLSVCVCVSRCQGDAEAAPSAFDSAPQPEVDLFGTEPEEGPSADVSSHGVCFPWQPIVTTPITHHLPDACPLF